MDIEILYEMYKSEESFKNLIQKGNTVPDGKKPLSGLDAVKNMENLKINKYYGILLYFIQIGLYLNGQSFI